MTTGTLRLRDDLVLDLRYEDRTPFGSALTGLADRLVRQTCQPLFERFRWLGSDEARFRAASLLARCFDSHSLGGLYERPGRLHACCVYPDPSSVIPAALRMSMGGLSAGSTRLPRSVSRDLAGWLSEWSRPGHAPRSAEARATWDALAEAGALCEEPELEPALDDGLTFVGHGTVAFCRDGVRLLFDPFFPAQRTVEEAYRPLRPRELAPHAVFVTHSHPEHFSPASLLMLGIDTPVYVPAVPRESLLTVDMAMRLRELGFTNVHTLAWGESVDLGPYRITAHPFWGEQPTDRDVLHPELANLGNTYVVDDGQERVALIADAGRDRRGNVLDQAKELALRGDTVDIVLGGYRATRIHPAQYLSSAVARYLLFVPQAAWQRRFRSMNDADDLMATASAWGARFVVPYANGGAPWYWENGVGPRLDEHRDGSDPDFQPVYLAGDQDRPRPEVVRLHPGEGLALQLGRPIVSARAGRRWPFGAASA